MGNGRNKNKLGGVLKCRVTVAEEKGQNASYANERAKSGWI